MVNKILLNAIIRNTPGTPKASGKQLSSPKHCTSFRSTGVNADADRLAKVTEM